ncbi:MAG: hypothetical protein FJX76_01200 [Armatimonadetes bacterium]|nr:hypothetical protein [Armatimonadota bacterium]
MNPRGWLFCGAAVVLLTLFWIFRGQAMYLDEKFYVDQIVHYFQGDFSYRNPMNAMPPGYHAVLAAVAGLVGSSDLGVLRFLNVAIALGFAALFYAVARRIDPSTATLRTAQCLALPVVLPFTFLVYTDIFSMAMLLGALYATMNGRSTMAGLICSGSILVRHNNIFFALMLMAWIVAEKKRALAGFVPAFILFGGVMLWWNRGLVAGDAMHHPPGIYTGNLFLTLIMLLAFFLPVALDLLGEFRLDERGRRALLLWAVLGALFVFAFPNNHPYNHSAQLVRNFVLEFFTRDLEHRLLFLPLLAAVAWLLVADPLRTRHGGLLYGVSLAYLLPIWLAEPRFCLVPLVLFTLFRQTRGWLVETACVVVNVGFCAYLLSIMLSRPRFPFFL